MGETALMEAASGGYVAMNTHTFFDSTADEQSGDEIEQFTSEEERKNSYVYELPQGSIFRLYNGKLFKRGNRKVKRYECIELSTGRLYLFQPNAEVELVK